MLASCKHLRTARFRSAGTLVGQCRVDQPPRARSASSMTLAIDTKTLISRHLDRATIELFRLHETCKVNL